MDRRILAVGCVSVALAFAALAPAQDAIEPVGRTGQQQQEVQVLHGQPQQEVEAVAGAGEQEVAKNTVPSALERRAKTAGKVIVVALATAVGLAASAASLLFL